MPPSRNPDLFSAFIDRLADAVAERIASRLPAQGVNGAVQSRRGGKGKKRNMACHYPGCKNRSKGPRFRYLCEQHLKLPKKQQQAALEKWKAKAA